MQKEDLQRLLDRYAQGTATAGERAQVEAFFARLETQAEASGYDNIEGDAAAFKNRLLQGILAKHAARQKKKSRAMIWRAAAAILLLAVAGYGLVQWGFTPAPTVASQQDLIPGYDHAILQLADGTQVLLDTTQQVNLPTQGHTSITNGQGQLSYAATTGVDDALLYNTITTPRGGRYQVTLADGTRVWLNAASSLRYPTAFTEAVRQVTLTGEAYFEVAKNKQQPFEVTVNDMTVKVLGTHFNVMAYAEEATRQTTLVEGRVQVVSGRAQQLLQPGEQAQLTMDGAFEMVSGGDVVQEALAWKNGMFRFEESSITAIMRQVGRWYDADIAYAEDVRDLYFAVTVSRRNHVSTLLQSLELTNMVYFDIREDAQHQKTIVVKKGPRPKD